MNTNEKAEERRANWRKHHALLAQLVLSEDDELAGLVGELGHAAIDEERLRLARALAQTVLEGLLSGRAEDWAPVEVAMAAAAALRPKSRRALQPAASGIRPAQPPVDRPSPDTSPMPSPGQHDSAESSKIRKFQDLASLLDTIEDSSPPHVGDDSAASWDLHRPHVGDDSASSWDLHRPHVGDDSAESPPSTAPPPPSSGAGLPLTPPIELPAVGPDGPTPSSTITETTLPAVSPPSVVPLRPVPTPPRTRPDGPPPPASVPPHRWPSVEPIPRPPREPSPLEPAPLEPAPLEPAPLSPTLPSYAPPTPRGTPPPRPAPPNVVPLRPTEPLPKLVPMRPAAHLLDDTATEAAALPMPVERYAALTALSEHAYHEQRTRILAAFGMQPDVDRRRLDAVYADTFRRRPSLRQRFGQALEQWRAMLAGRSR